MRSERRAAHVVRSAARGSKERYRTVRFDGVRIRIAATAMFVD
jgi:hypothetical protein